MPAFDLQDYVQVNERIEKFRADHPTWGLESVLVHNDGKTLIVRAVVTDETGRLVATGHAEEVRGSTPVNRTSPLENCETSAWGRALANLGYDVRRSIASREEMQKAQDMTPGSDPSRTRAAARATGAASPASPSPSPAAPRSDIQSRRDVLWSRVDSLSPAEKAQLKVLLEEQKFPTDFDAHTAEDIDAIEAILVESFNEPF